MPERAELLGNDVSTALSAAGTTIADATDITTETSSFGTVAASSGAQLPSKAKVGGVFFVENRGANALSLYPHSSTGTLNGGSAGDAVSVAAGELALCIRLSETDWLVRIAVAP